jgi:BirA family biotin operon repressor/biotin-[acetyl-CoA-carboxylase] ligase
VPDRARLRADLEARLGLPVLEHGKIDSTMAAAMADGGPAPCVHLAESQTAGRGRFGRSWASPPGNLHATIRWPDPGADLPPALLAAIQVAWAGALRAAGGLDARCKWPNDGWLGGGKWSGVIALRSAGRPGEIHVGLGANLVAAPPGVGDPPATALMLHWPGWPGADAVSELLLAAALDVLGDGPGGIRTRLERWSRYDALVIGEAVVVESGGRLRQGTYRGVDADGRLRLEEEAGEVRLSGGEVTRLRAG